MEWYFVLLSLLGPTLILMFMGVPVGIAFILVNTVAAVILFGRFDSFDANLFATVSTTMLVVGGVAVAAGGGWLIYHYVEGDGASDNNEIDAVTVRPLVGPGFAGIEGSF